MRGRPFSSFVIFAEMRTGSNFLEENINQFPDLQSYGELFNPYFVGFDETQELCGISLAARDAAPLRMLDAIRSATPDGVAGFRFFNDHDPRILAHVMADPACAKIILTRNPLESYVSRLIATQTGQWQLPDLKHHIGARVRFDADAFETHLDVLQAFQLRLLRGLQTTGQTGFYVDYEDLGDVDVINGIARFLGSEHQVKTLTKSLKKQNPEPVTDKVSNPADLTRALAGLDRFNLARTPNFEPRRGARVPSYYGGVNTSLLFLPIKGGPVAPVLDWMARHERAAGAPGDDLLTTGFNQKTLRQWRRQHPGHQSFTVLRHPLARAHDSYCRYILAGDDEDYLDIREILRQRYGLELPEAGRAPDYSLRQHRRAFLDFLIFLRGNLSAQTSIRVDPAWASQVALVQGMSGVAPPDHLLREDSLAPSLRHLEALTGCASEPVEAAGDDLPFSLSDIYDAELEKAAHDAYARDYVTFGFREWAAA